MREEVRPGRREGVGWQRRKRHARGGPDSRLGARARTRNIWPMFVTLDVSKLSGWLNAAPLNMAFMLVTLDVSKLSGWLNATAYCRIERAGM